MTDLSAEPNSSAPSALGDRMARRGLVADLFIFGRPAMALTYDAKRVTRDVYATFIPNGVVMEEARNVADSVRLPPWWVNEQASAYVSAQKDAGSVGSSTVTGSEKRRPGPSTYLR